MRLKTDKPARLQSAIAAAAIAGSTLAASAALVLTAGPQPALAQDERSIADLRDNQINQFCADCHMNLADVDNMLFVPEEYRLQ